MEFYKEIINLENIREYKELIDSIRYICNFNGFDPGFEYDEDIKNPSIPENGKLENNHFVGYRLKENKEPCIYVQYYESFMSENTIFLGNFLRIKNFMVKDMERKSIIFLKANGKN